MPSSITDLTYSSQTIQTASVSLEAEARVATAGAETTIELFVNLDPTSEPEVETITIDTADLPAADSYYLVEVVGPTVTKTYVYLYEVAGTPTAAEIAADLAPLITLHPEVQAVQGGAGVEDTIIVTALTPGTAGAFTLNVSCVAVADNSPQTGTPITVAQTTAASGTGKMRKLGQVGVAPAIGADRKFRISIKTPTLYNGAAVPVAVSTLSDSAITHPQTMDKIREDN